MKFSMKLSCLLNVICLLGISDLSYAKPNPDYSGTDAGLKSQQGGIEEGNSGTTTSGLTTKSVLLNGALNEICCDSKQLTHENINGNQKLVVQLASSEKNTGKLKNNKEGEEQ